MIKESVIVDEVIALLNEAVALDRKAMENLLNARVECNEALADHPTIQVSNYFVPGKYVVGILGILNGIFGISETGFGVIAANMCLEPPAQSEEEAKERLAKGEIQTHLLGFSRMADKYLHKE